MVEKMADLRVEMMAEMTAGRSAALTAALMVEMMVEILEDWLSSLPYNTDKWQDEVIMVHKLLPVPELILVSDRHT